MEITRTVEVYTLDELSEEARSRAVARMVEQAAESLSYDPWLVSESVNGRYVELATGEEWGDETDKALEEGYGVRVLWTSYPFHAAVDGTVSRDSSPALSWPDGVTRFTVSADGYHGVSMTVDAVYGRDSDGREVEVTDKDEAIEAMLRALCDELAKNVETRYTDLESEETALQVYRDNDDQRRFLADGSEAPEAFWSDDEA